MKRTLLALCIRNPVSVNLMMLVILLIGFFSAYNLQRETFPEIELDLFHVVAEMQVMGD